MTVWCHLPTIFKRRYVLQIAGLVAICVAIITTLFFNVVSHAAPGINETLSFQGRLSRATGGVVPDGYYNIQFKIYQDGAGTSAGNSGGTLKWTETYINDGGTDGVMVKNGLFSVNLGSVNAFDSSVDWNQDTLWLSMNVAGSSTSCTTYGTAPCTADGEMLPMKRMTATPFSLNSARLGGIQASGFIQNTSSPQTADLNITGTGTFSTKILTPTLDTASAGSLSIGTTNATSISLGKNTTISGSAGAPAATINQADAGSSVLTLQQAGVNVLNVANQGAVSITTKTASNSDFSVKGPGTTSNFNIDTLNGYTINNGTSSPDNLIENPSFESDAAAELSGWKNLGTNGIAIGTTNPRAGIRALTIPANGTQNGSTTAKMYATEQGDEFYAEAWSRTASGTNGTGAVVFNYYDSSKAFLSATSISIANGTTYIKTSGTAVTPASAAYVAMNVSAGSSSTTGTWYFDDLYFAKVSQKQSLKLQDASGSTQVSLDNTTGSIQGSSLDTTTSSALSIGSANASSISIGNASTTRTNTLFGQTIIRSASDSNSTIAFQLQRSDGTAMFIADSTNQTITIGNAISGDTMVISTENGQVVYYGSARHTKKITLNAEYTGSVLDAGTGSNNTGTMTSSIDLTNRMNYYKWTTNQVSNQSYDVVVQVPLPTDFDGWASSNPLSIAGYTSDTTNGTISLEARDSTNAVRCNFVSVTPSSTSTWATNNTACTLDSGTYTGGDYITLRIRMQSPNGGNVRVGTINLSYLSKY